MLSMISLVRTSPRLGGTAVAKQASVLTLRTLSSTAGTNYDVVVIGMVKLFTI